MRLILLTIWLAPGPPRILLCEGALVGVGRDTLYFSEPLGPGRTSFTLHCSCDGGTTWNSSNALTINPGAGAQYSALVPLAAAGGGTKLLAIWEDHPNQRVGVFGTEWCKCLRVEEGT